MSGFSATWLALRESHDIRARNTDVLAAVTAAYQRHPTINIADLACGTGSTMAGPVFKQLLDRQHFARGQNK